MAFKIIFVVFMVYLYGCFEATVLKKGSIKKLVIDHDGGADDAVAIAMGLLYEKYFNGPKVVALTTTFGNVNLNQSIINSDRILNLCKRNDIPIYSGAYQGLITKLPSDHFFGYDGLGDDGYSPSAPIQLQKEPAAVALLELSKKYEGELIIVAIGPLTNIALAARMDPKFIHRLAHLYVGAGHIYSKQFPQPEFNALMDPEAYRIVTDIATLNKVTFITLSQVQLTFKISVDWRKNVFGKIPTSIVQALNGFERIALPKTGFWTILDPVVMAVALTGDLLVDEFRNTCNSIILQGPKRGITTNEFSSKYYPNARIVYSGNMMRYKTFLLKVFSAEVPSYKTEKQN